MPQMTLDEILAEANRALSSANALKVSTDADAAAATRRRETGPQLRPISKARRLVDRVKDTFGDQPIVRVADTVAPAAAMASNPIGQAAGAYLAMKSLDEMTRNPSVMNAGMTALGALPFVGHLPSKFAWADAARKNAAHVKDLNAGKTGAKAASSGGGWWSKTPKSSVGEVDRFMPNTPGFSGPPKAAEIPKPGGTPYQRPTPFSRADPHMPNQPASASDAFGEAAERITPSVERFTPNQPADAADIFGDAAEQIQSRVRIGADQYHPMMQSLDNMSGGGALDDMVRQTVTEPMPGPFGSVTDDIDDVLRGGADDVPNNPVARRTEAERRAGRELTDPEIEQVLAEQADQFDNGALPAHLRALDNAHDARMADWRTIPPDPNSKARFVKEHVGKSQQQMAQELGERDLGWAGRAKIKRVKAPLYPSGDSKVDKLVAAMRQREKLMGFQD